MCVQLLTSKGISLRDWFKGYDDKLKLVNYLFKLVLLSLVDLTFVAFYFVVPSIQETIGSIIYIYMESFFSVGHCHNNAIMTIPLPVISVWLCDYS